MSKSRIVTDRTGLTVEVTHGVGIVEVKIEVPGEDTWMTAQISPEAWAELTS